MVRINGPMLSMLGGEGGDELEKEARKLGEEAMRFLEAHEERSREEAVRYVKEETGEEELADAIEEIEGENARLEQFRETDDEEKRRSVLESYAEKIYRREDESPYTDLRNLLRTIFSITGDQGHEWEKTVMDPEKVRGLREDLEDFDEEEVLESPETREKLCERIDRYHDIVSG